MIGDGQILNHVSGVGLLRNF